MESERAFEQSLYDHAANALNAWRTMRGKEMPPEALQEELFAA